MARLFPWAAFGLVSSFGAIGCVREQPPAQAAGKQPMCWRYEALTAAIASATIDCQGTIGPQSFSLDDKGMLVPTFTSCIPGATNVKPAPNAAAPAPVAGAAPSAAASPAQAAPAASTDATQAAKDYDLLKQLLSFQQIPNLPDMQECIGGRWKRWSELFKRTNITTCPTWEKTEVIGAPVMSANNQDLTALQYRQMQPRLPSVPRECNERQTKEERKRCALDSVHAQIQKDPALKTEQALADVLLPPKTSATYTVKVDPSVKCSDPAVCAAQCAAAFPGFVLAASGNRVDGDATYWLSADPPHTYDGLQHPMAQFHGPPGDMFGHFNRIGEECWRWDDFDGLYVEVLNDARLPVPISVCGNY